MLDMVWGAKSGVMGCAGPRRLLVHLCRMLVGSELVGDARRLLRIVHRICGECSQSAQALSRQPEDWQSL